MTAMSSPPSAALPTASPKSATACSHCDLPVPAGLIVPDADEQFCCAGCASVYRMIHGCDLGRYYHLRDVLGSTTPPVGPAADPPTRYEAFDQPAFFDAHTVALAGGLRQIDLRLSNVHCAACVWLVERLPKVCPGVIEARLSLGQMVARVTWEASAVRLSAIATTLHRLGYPPHPAGSSEARSLRIAQERQMLVRIGVAGACAGNAMLLAVSLYLGLLDGMAAEFETFLRWISLIIGGVALGWPGGVFFRGAWAGWRTRRVTLDLPIALALGVGGLAGLINVVTGRGDIYFDSLCVLVFLLLVGRYLQMRQQRRAIDAVSLMQSLTPVGCEVRRGNAWVSVPLESVVVGDRVRVASNERLPVDGTVCEGVSSLDTSSLTGESRPCGIEPGDAVFAGTQNVGPAIQVSVSAAGRDTRVAQLMEAASADVSNKPAIVCFADRVAGGFTLAVVLLAGLVFGGWWWAVGFEPALSHAVALLIVACPCALGLATPMTLALALGVASRRDILVKDAAIFEKLARVEPARPGVLALDKTGTLTTGQPRVVAWLGDSAWQPVVGVMETDSKHPIGRALAQAYGQANPPDIDHVTEHGQGGVTATFDGRDVALGSRRWLETQGVPLGREWVEALDRHQDQGMSLVVVAVDRQVVAVVWLADSIRPGTAAALRELEAVGFLPCILSGDTGDAARHVGQALSIAPDHVHAELAPEDKTKLVARAGGEGQMVVMVGDGVNDAAALARADVGLAVKGGAEAALAVADAYTHRPGLAPLIDLVGLSRLTLRVVRQNLAVSLGYNALTVSLAAAGLLSPWIAAILMPTSSLTVLGLAVSRLGRWKGAR